MNDGEPGAEPPQIQLRRLGALVTEALRLCWAAAPRELTLLCALQAVSGLGLVLPILSGRDLLTEVLEPEAAVDVAPLLLRGIALLAMLGAVNLAGTVAGARDELLSELINQYATSRVLDAVSTAELERFELPAFHNRVQRAAVSAGTHPYQLAQGLGAVLQALLATAGVALALAVIEPALAAMTLAAAAPLWLAGIKSGEVMFAMVLRLTPAERERAYLVRLLTGRDSVVEIRAYGLAGYFRERWHHRTAERLTEIRGTVRARLRITLLARLLTAAIIASVLAVLVVAGLTERMSVADTSIAATSVLLLASRLRASAMGTDLLFEAAPFVADLQSFLDQVPAHRLAGARPLPEVPAHRLPQTRRRPPQPPKATSFERLTVEGLTFTYPSAARPALRGVDLQIRAGEIVALVGENGSGKTTLAKLLCHLYRPHGGRICYDGIDVTHADPDALRRSIAVLFQDFERYLLPATDNIGLGRWERLQDDAAIVRAATAAGANAFLAGLPNGYGTLLGPEFDDGTGLSGGQWQRVALARAFFRDAPFIILDEPTAALDARAEDALFARLRVLFAGRTVLLISHRFSTVRAADRIYVLADGLIAEHGTHEQLMARDGRYAELFTLQAAPYASAAGYSVCSDAVSDFSSDFAGEPGMKQ